MTKDYKMAAYFNRITVFWELDTTQRDSLDNRHIDTRQGGRQVD